MSSITKSCSLIIKNSRSNSTKWRSKPSSPIIIEDYRSKPPKKYLEEQHESLAYIKTMLDKQLPDDITELQKLLKPLLNNIFVAGQYLQSQTKFNIADTTTTDINIYTIPHNQAKLDIEKYKAFLKFMIQKLYDNNTEFSQDSGEIITAYCMTGNKEDEEEIEKIKARYKEIYVSKDSKKYPYWVDDLLAKSRHV